MLLFFLGFLTGVMILWLFLDISLKKYERLINEANNTYDKLEELCDRCVQVSAQMISDLEYKINQGHTLVEEVKGKKDKEVIYDSSQSAIKKRNTEAPLKAKDSLDLTSKHLKIIRLREEGWEIKDISREVGVGQDQVRMILQLFYQH